MVKNPAAKQEIRVWSLGQEDPPEKKMATHSSILAWHTPWRVEPGRLQSAGSEEPGGLQSLGLQAVLHALSAKDQQQHTVGRDIHWCSQYVKQH